jgi:glycosyltransferase involved in cell wall biosynthesis
MKKIGIDGRLISQTGVGRYIQNLLYYLPENDNFIFFVYLLKSDFKKISLDKKNFIKREANLPWHTFSEQIGFLKILLADSLDLIHFTYFSYPVLYRRKFITTVHDLTPLLFKTGKASSKNIFFYKFKHFFFRQILSAQIKNSKAIITPSKTVKKQIVRYYGKCFENKIFPIYEGVDHQLITAEENISLKNKFSKPFFIYVGNFYPHKNVGNLLRAFASIKSDAKLILLGPDDYFAKRMFQSINRLKQNDKIVLYKNPKIEDLVFFYKNTQAIIHPSFSEGFGLPLIEAAYFNCPVIASDIPVFNEIMNNQYLKFDPQNIRDIAVKINFFLQKKPKYDYSQILKKYSFKKMAEETVKIYKTIITA